MRRPFPFAAIVIPALALGVFGAACAGTQLREESEIVRRQLDRARASGAKRCAPRELAIAETNHVFANAELDKGNADRAHDHMSLAATAVAKAIEDSKDCGPRTVIIKEPEPEPVVAVQLKDRDGDGVPDNDDLCPDEPGPKENKGCPWPDTDGDGIIDPDDKCPNEPGPKENKGCPWDDRDGDGVLDPDDACPDEPGPRDNKGCPWPDTDGDGIIDSDDECPFDPGPVENKGCPILDTDGDGILDPDDECPNEPGPKENKGCPWQDTDGDGILDPDDKCPNEPGIPELQGCPPTDRDGDGIPDHLDECPDEPGVIEERGCPRKYSLVVLKKEKIEILEQVHFETGKYRILPDSFGLLDQVALVLKDHPTIRVRIEGHTDSVGSAKSNMTLSQNRANSVRDYLINVGVSADRLYAVGFGQTAPIAPNTTVQGRAKNRRVEFNITAR